MVFVKKKLAYNTMVIGSGIQWSFGVKFNNLSLFFSHFTGLYHDLKPKPVRLPAHDQLTFRVWTNNSGIFHPVGRMIFSLFGECRAGDRGIVGRISEIRFFWHRYFPAYSRNSSNNLHITDCNSFYFSTTVKS
jgi:hypothetical protein